jgi:tyrosinase
MSHTRSPHDTHAAPTLFSEIDLDPEVAGRALSEHIAAERGLAQKLRASAAAALAKAEADEPVAEPFAAARTRPDQREFGDAVAFRNAVQRLVDDGTYRTLVLIHADMSHNMHSMPAMGPAGTLRFLAWHRRYLMAFDEALRSADRALRPDAASPVSIPYWRWVDPFPVWLADFLPARHPQTGQPLPARVLAPASRKPTAADVATIIDGFGGQLAGQDVDDYTRFTWGLEGNGLRPDGTRLPAHNSVHSWVGGILDNTRLSPADPAFWLLHAEVDRLWHIWQIRYPGRHPALTGGDRVMDPWPESYDDLASLTTLGYDYASEVP